MTEAILEPDLPIIDPHHHLWDLRPMIPAFPDPRHDFIAAIAEKPYYTFDALQADTDTGHNIIAHRLHGVRCVLRSRPGRGHESRR